MILYANEYSVFHKEVIDCLLIKIVYKKAYKIWRFGSKGLTLEKKIMERVIKLLEDKGESLKKDIIDIVSYIRDNDGKIISHPCAETQKRMLDMINLKLEILRAIRILRLEE